MHIIDIDLSQLKVGDEIFCGFDKDLLEYNDGDERSLLYSCENEKQIMGLCAYDPMSGIWIIAASNLKNALRKASDIV